MAGKVTLKAALAQIESNRLTERAEGLSNLKHIIRSSQQDASFGDSSFHILYEALFQLAFAEQSAWLSATKPAPRSSADTRLSNTASVLRLAVEAGTRTIHLKTVRALLDHIIEALPLSDGGLCSPLALDYAKCMRTVFSYQPHVEHLSHEEWERAAFLCFETIKGGRNDSQTDDVFYGAEGRSINSLSYRSSRSHIKESSQSHHNKTLSKQVADEMVATLSLLTAAPNAPLASGANASTLLWALIDFLRDGGRSQQDAFSAVNHLLSWTRTEYVILTQKATGHLIRLIRNFWTQKQSSLRDEMLITLLYLRPYVIRLVSKGEGLILRSDLAGLFDVMRFECSKRSDRDLLRLDDLRLSIGTNSESSQSHVRYAIFELRCVSSRADTATETRVERSWALMSTLAIFFKLLISTEKESASSEDDNDEGNTPQRPHKRQRLVNEYSELLVATCVGTTAERVCALQILTVLAQERRLSLNHISRAIDKLIASCSEENSTVASWAFLALASYASQASAIEAILSGRWNDVWQLATRAMTNTSTCRAACHLLSVLIELQLVTHAAVSELTQMVTGSTDLSGPSILADSILGFFLLCMRSVQQLSPQRTSLLAQSILGWLCRIFTPSKFEEKHFAVTYHLFGIRDVMSLIDATINHREHTAALEPFPQWEAVARAWITCRDQDNLVSYLLLLPGEDTITNPILLKDKAARSATAITPRVACETMVLNHFISELEKIQDTWNQCYRERPQGINMDMFGSLCNACCIAACVAHCRSFRDTRRQFRMQKQLDELLASIREFVAGSDCGQDKVDMMLLSCSQMFGGLHPGKRQHCYSATSCEKILCHHVTKALSARRRTKDLSQDHVVEDIMDISEDYSQDSRRDKSKAMVERDELENDAAVAYSAMALRSAIGLYTVAIEVVTEGQINGTPVSSNGSKRVVEYILRLSDVNIIASRTAISALPSLGLLLDASDFEHLMDHCTAITLSSYSYSRSEVALGAILDILSSCTSVWTNSEEKSLFDLSIDTYEWYMKAHSKGVLSRNVHKRLANLLVQICHANIDYGNDSDTGSVSISLFKLLSVRSVVVQHHLAHRISTILELFVLSEHEQVFENLRSSLPADADWIEGLAMRLLLLSRLASSWYSLRRHCVYYIFETAGLVKESEQYAAHCISELTHGLQFKSAQSLFQLFSPQLLHTWLEHHTLSSLPYVAFQYASLGELLRQNQEEITAQLFMRGRDDGIHVLCTELKLPEKELVKRSFAKCVAYAISWDILMSLGESDGPTSEARIRNLIGKEEMKRLIIQQFPTIMGIFYLSTQQDDPQDKWIERRPLYASAAKALLETRQCSYSEKTLPTSQQPSFKTRYLPDQIERLCRRTAADSTKPFTASSFALAARMLLDAIEDALGPLHTCLMLRKLRTLICMSGDVAFTSFPLEMLVHTVRPFLSDSECSDDALGILQYLLHHGQPYFKTEGLAFVNGAVSLMVLQMREHSAAKQSSMTQESQHRVTVKKMKVFQDWLVQYLQQCNAHNSGNYRQLVETLSTVGLPGNARTNSPESTLLLLLLDQMKWPEAPLYQPHCVEALQILARGFECPKSSSEDCLGKDEVSVVYAESLWRLIKCAHLDDSFLTWAAAVLGRAYAATGLRPHGVRSSNAGQSTAARLRIKGRVHSQANITDRLAHLMLSSKRTEAGLADWTMRSIAFAFTTVGDAEEALAFEQMLPDNIIPAITDGPCGYKPPSMSKAAAGPPSRKEIREALQFLPAPSEDEWAETVATIFCQWASDTPILSALPALLQSVHGLAAQVLPYITHLILVEERDRDPVIHDELSASLAAQFAPRDEQLRSRQRFLIRLLLYLRSQPLPGEATKADRLHWLDINTLQAAEAAARCGMPTSALLLAESIPPVMQPSRRVSARLSLSQLTPVHIPDELLLSIFKQVEEPDSYYGVQQAASLDAVLERLDYEGSGFKSLMLRSAQLDSVMRAAHQPSESEAAGLMRSLSVLNLNSLEYALLSGPMGNSSHASEEMLDAARKLQQWDLLTPEGTHDGSVISFRAFQELSRANDPSHMSARLHMLLLDHVKSNVLDNDTDMSSTDWCNALATLTEIGEVLNITSETELKWSWEVMQRRLDWMQSARFEDAQPLVSARSTLFSVLVQNTGLTRGLHIGAKAAKLLEAESILSVARFSREHGVLQEALSAATQLSLLATPSELMELKLNAAAALETASVLWEAGEVTTSVRMLENIARATDCETQDIPVGRSGLLAQLGHQLAEARLLKADEILKNCLKPAITHLKDRNRGQEAGSVFHEFASFCDQQLQNPGNLEDFRRIAKLRQRRLDEVGELESIAHNPKKPIAERDDAKNASRKARQWLGLDDGEYQRLKQSRDDFMVQSLQNYMLALCAYDKHDIDVLRFFAMWLENADSAAANSVVSKHITSVPSWKFAVIINQIMSRLEHVESPFQHSLKALVQRICGEHPYHGLHQLFAVTRRPDTNDETALSRFRAAQSIRQTLQATSQSGPLLKSMFEANNAYITFAFSQPDKSRDKISVRAFPPALEMVNRLRRVKVPPATISVQLRPDGNYSDVPILAQFDSSFTLMGGISAPKCISAYATDGLRYKQLFKGGNDDLRQDSIMEQVFEEVSKMLRKHKATRERHLHVRTYKVIPLAPKCGIIEFVPNSIPIGEWLKPAHVRYHPKSYKYSSAFNKIREVEKNSLESRLVEYRKIADQTPPVMRHFFFEHYDDPDEWFEKRTAYTRTTASVSILGYVLGLGDRHCQNILLDEKSGEAVHIDLGVAFEAGRVLPIPETVPFRLTRDIVDAMGVTKTEGVFRRCCEFTMDALRDDKGSIMTLLNVLRYDPLYNWTLSPLRAKRMQDAQEIGQNAVDGEASTRRKEQEAGEAERALSIVEKKLSKTLSTAATVNELIQQATDEKNLATLFAGWSAWL